MATLVGAAILVLAAAIVLPDFLRSLRASPRTDPGVGAPLIPGSVNDPSVLALQARLDSLAIMIGSGVGGVAGGGVGSAVSGSEVGLARGLGANTISDAEIQSIVERTAGAASAAGAAGGTNTGTVAGEGIGSGLVSFILGAPAGALRAAAASDLLKTGGLADRLGLPKWGG